MASKDVKFTDELAVMLDTFHPLLLTKQALEMDEDERTRRARGLSRTVLAHTPATWLADQLDMLDRAVRLRGSDE